jgi:dTDP-4-dehydrorhamnose reductase
LPEVWGGVECTVNRVGDRYFHQMERSGHSRRVDDLERFAALGIRAIRYPALWELVAPHGLERADWSWPDERLHRLRELGVRPIVGLVHHGSGPRHTSLAAPDFADGLARFARAAAERYPWVEDWTPVNEPLTTARFSGLYGHWYPHGRDERTFSRALVVQCRATAEAMRAIREVVPGARLVQTEDVGRTYGTPALRDQVEFDNDRRWLSLDLLCGRVDRGHRFWDWLLRHGISAEELERFLAAPTPPAVVGLNYYITSDRYLDEHLEAYPSWTHGGNGRTAYADVEAVRVRPEGILGHRAALQSAWQRYGLPVALTEVHLGATREEQLRWLLEAWDAARALRTEGADVRAITVWSLLGAFDWNSLVTADCGFYEPGPLDVRSHEPRPTALAGVTRDLALRGCSDHPVLGLPGWWRRSDRVTFGPWAGQPAPVAAEVRRGPGAARRRPVPLLVIGGRGTLGRGFARLCASRGLTHEVVSRAELDIASPQSVERALDAVAPWAVVNAAGYVRVDDAERDAGRCFRENARGPAVLAAACRERGVRLATFSSDLVFDGEADRPYVESDPVAPLNVYGASKAEAEREVLARDPSALVIRTSAFFGPWDSANFVTAVLGALRRGERFRAAGDAFVSPTYVPDLVNATLDLLVDGERGLWHLANDGAVSWADLARIAAAQGGLDPGLVDGVPLRELSLEAARPRWSVLGSERSRLLPPLADGIARFFRECDVAEVRRPAGGGRADALEGGCPASP